MAEAKLHTAVNIFHRRRALAKREKGFVEHRQQYPVDDETGRILCHHWRLADGLGKIAGHRCGLVAGRQTANDFDQPHQRHRIEEMHADKARRIFHRLRQSCDRDRGCIAGKNGLMAENFGSRCENLAFDLFPLGCRFDDDIGIGHRIELDDRFNPAKRCLGCLMSDFFLFDQSSQLLGNTGFAAFGDLHADVRQIDMIACLRRNLSDTGAHLPRSDNANRFHSISLALFFMIQQATSDYRSYWLDCTYAPYQFHRWNICDNHRCRRHARGPAWRNPDFWRLGRRLRQWR